MNANFFRLIFLTLIFVTSGVNARGYNANSSYSPNSSYSTNSGLSDVQSQRGMGSTVSAAADHTLDLVRGDLSSLVSNVDLSDKVYKCGSIATNGNRCMDDQVNQKPKNGVKNGVE